MQQPLRAQQLRRDTVTVHDTVYLNKEELKQKRDIVEGTNLIRIKAIGRYDRGIVSYRFIPKGKWIGGLTFSYINFDSDDSRLLFSLLKDFDCGFKTFSFDPFAGYAVKDNVVIGLKVGYNHTIADLGNLSIDIGDDSSFSLSNMRYAEDLYSVSFFHRSYIGLDHGKLFGLFNETSLTYENGTASFRRGADATADDYKNTETTINELNLGINPGVAVFITQNVCAELSFGVVGFQYRIEKQRNNLGEIGKRRSSGADFKINLFNINIGITFCM
jgi:hypothetical protein